MKLSSIILVCGFLLLAIYVYIYIYIYGKGRPAKTRRNIKLVQFRPKILNVVTNSLYITYIRKNKGMILACILISTFLCILTYPGIMYTDSYARISFVSNLKMSIHAFLNGDVWLYEVGSWLTVTPSFFIMLSKEIVGSVVLYTFLQCFCFFLITYIFGDYLTKKNHKIWNRFCITVSPVMWAFGVFYEASVGCVTAILCLILLIWKWEQMQSRFDKIFTCLLIIISSYICFGYRANAFTILPALILIILIKYRNRIRSLVMIGSIFLGFLFTSLIPKMLNINTMSSYAAGFAWEIVSTIQTMDSEKQAEYADYLDDIFGSGSTQQAIDNSHYIEQNAHINNMLAGSINASAISEPGNPKRILKKYVGLIKREPQVYIKTKWDFVSHMLGIGKSLTIYGYEYNLLDSMGQFGFNDSVPRKTYVNYFNAFMLYMKVFRMPWVMFLTALVLIAVYRIKICGIGSELNIYEATYFIALFYYGAYLVNTQSFEFRYYFPSWLLLFLIIISLLADILFERDFLKHAAVMSFCFITIACIFGGYEMYTKAGGDMIYRVSKSGKLLYENDENRVYYYKDNLYFIANRKADTEYPYSLYFYPVEGDMIINDFSFKEKEIPSPFWTEDISVVELPKQALISLGFGQCYYNVKLWESYLDFSSFLTVPSKILVSDYTDNEWTGGYSNTENCLLLDNDNIQNYWLKGKGLLLPSGTVARILDVVEVDGSLRIYTDMKIDDITIRRIPVVD